MASVDPNIVQINGGNVRINALYDGRVRDQGLQRNQFLVLYALVEGGIQTHKALATRTSLIKQTVSNVVSALADRGFVTLSEGASDRRERIVSLADAVERHAHEVLDGILDVERRVIEELNERRMGLLADLTEAYAEALDAVLDNLSDEM